jgi:hypothetical protein
MTDNPTSTDTAYNDANLQRLLAEDIEIAELGIEIRRRGGALVLCGQVESGHRKDAIERRIAEHLDGQADRTYQLVNEIVVTAVDAPVRAEELP